MKHTKDHIRDYELANSLTFNSYLRQCGNDYAKAKRLAMQDKDYIRRLQKIEDLYRCIH